MSPGTNFHISGPRNDSDSVLQYTVYMIYDDVLLWEISLRILGAMLFFILNISVAKTCNFCDE